MEVSSEDFSNMEEIINSETVNIYTITDLVKKDDFVAIFENIICDISRDGNSIRILGREKFSSLFLQINEKVANTKYSWTDLRETFLFPLLPSMIPMLKTNREIFSCKLYLGDSGSGSHLHYHYAAVNYLVSGKKKWIIFPNNEHNTNYVNSLGFVRGESLNITVSSWINRNERKLKENIQDLQILTQEEGTAFLVPNQFYHLVLNLEPSMGIVISYI